jgi:hypothetical protein
MKNIKKRMRKSWTRRGRARLAGQEGFTLAELLVFIGIMLIFMIGIGGMIASGVNSSTASYMTVKATEAGNGAISTMIRQIRVANSVSSDPLSGNDRLVFMGDLNGDSIDEAQGFYVQGNYLMMGDQQWIEDAQSITFTYFEYNEETKQVEELAVGSPDWNSRIRRIDIELVISDTGPAVTVSKTFTGSVTLRNALQ